MLDGFDFSTGVSICRALASDSDEEEATPINNNNDNKEGLPAITDKHQLTNALLNVLKIPPGGTGEAPTRPLRAMTLDEIEEPRPQEVDQDQSAFNKLLAAINSPHGGPPGAGIEGHVSQGRREVRNYMYMYIYMYICICIYMYIHYSIRFRPLDMLIEFCSLKNPNSYSLYSKILWVWSIN